MVHLIHSLQAVAAQAAQQPRPTPRPPIPSDLDRQIEDAVQQAVQSALEAATATGAGGAGGAGAEAAGARELARERARDAFERVREAVDAARTNTRTEVQFPVGPPDIPPQAVDMAYAFFATIAFIAVGLPLARAFARRMDRRSAPAPADLAPRLDRIEQAVEAVAIEVERISENQRYSTKVMQELRGLPASQPAGWPGSNARQAEPVPRAGDPQRP